MTVLTAASFAASAVLPASATAPAERRTLPPGAASCLECHGRRDDGDAAGPPALATLTPDEIADALDAFRSGRRAGTIMPRLAGGFSPREARALAEALSEVPGKELGKDRAPGENAR